MNTLMESPILQEIGRAAEAVTDKQLARIESKLDKLTDADKSLGVVTNPLSRRLFTVALHYGRKMREFALMSKGAETDEDEKEYQRLSVRADQIQDVVLELLWTQVREELNLFQPELHQIGLRESWMVVQPPTQNEVAIASLGVVRDAFRKFMEDSASE